MSVRTKSTLKMLCSKAGIANVELTKEAQRLLDLYNDPNVDQEQKLNTKAELDKAIEKLEARVTTRRLKESEGKVDLSGGQR